MNLYKRDIELYLQCIHEALHGFTIVSFVKELNVDRSQLLIEEGLLRELLKQPSAWINTDIPIRPEIIASTIRELGHEEFMTRTSFPLVEAESLYDRVKNNLRK